MKPVSILDTYNGIRIVYSSESSKSDSNNIIVNENLLFNETETFNMFIRHYLQKHKMPYARYKEDYSIKNKVLAIENFISLNTDVSNVYDFIVSYNYNYDSDIKYFNEIVFYAFAQLSAAISGNMLLSIDELLRYYELDDFNIDNFGPWKDFVRDLFVKLYVDSKSSR